MPMVTARRLCPQAIFVPNDPEAYGSFSERIREVFLSYTPLVEPLSLDEAFLDVSGSVRLFGSPEAIAHQVKRDIGRLGLPCTVGVAPNKFLAKLASTVAKPDGLLVVGPDEVEGFLHPLPVGALWGVGAATGEVLRRLGLKTVGDIAAVSRRTLERAVGEALGAHLHTLALGFDDRDVVVNEPARSIGHENTFEADLDDRDQIMRELLRLSERTGSRLRSKSLCARTVTLKVRFSNFKTITRSKTPGAEFDTGPEIYGLVRALFLKLDPNRPRIRLLGVSVSGLETGPPRRQLDLLSGPALPDRDRKVSDAVDSIRERFGNEAVSPATLLDDPR
jgi:DNA polymerase-4